MALEAAQGAEVPWASGWRLGFGLCPRTLWLDQSPKLVSSAFKASTGQTREPPVLQSFRLRALRDALTLSRETDSTV